MTRGSSGCGYQPGGMFILPPKIDCAIPPPSYAQHSAYPTKKRVSQDHRRGRVGVLSPILTQLSNTPTSCQSPGPPGWPSECLSRLLRSRSGIAIHRKLALCLALDFRRIHKSPHLRPGRHRPGVLFAFLAPDGRERTREHALRGPPRRPQCGRPQGKPPRPSPFGLTVCSTVISTACVTGVYCISNCVAN